MNVLRMIDDSTTIKLSLVALLLTSSCTQPDPENKTPVKTEAMNTESKEEVGAKTTLKELLDEKKNTPRKNTDPKKKQAYADGIQAVEESGVTQSAKQVGDKAPNFSLADATGKTISLEDQLENGPVILTWYRGGWCPYCNITLSRLQEELPRFKAAGAELIALTPELPDNSMNTTEKNALEFLVLSDIGSQVARDYGVLFKLTDDVAGYYNASFDLDNHNGNDKHELPLAATYVIDTDGIIQYAFLDSDYRNRAEPADILMAPESMN